MRTHASPVLLTLLLALLVAACGGGGTASLGSSDVLVVGGQKVTKGDLDVMMNRAKASFAANKQKFPTPGTQQYISLQGRAVTYLLQRAELAQRAADMGIHISNKQVDDRINLLKKQSYGNDEKRYEAALKQQGLTPDQYRDFQRFQLISEAVFKKISASVHVSDAAIKAYFEQNKTVYSQAESRDVRHILVKTKSLADTVYAQLVAANEKNFASLAKKYSKDPSSAANGGKLTIVRGRQVPEFDKTAFALKQGELAKPVHSAQYGWFIIQALSAIRPATTTSLAKVKDSIRQQLEQQKKNEVATTWFNDMQKQFCKPGKIKYQVGFQPTPDPCASVTSSTSSTSTK
jgi:parvulin-like peptidyl-prolyl isomerase